MTHWTECKIGDFLDVKHGFAFKGENITSEPTDTVLVTPGNFHIGGGFKDTKFKYYKGDYPEDYLFRGGEIVVTMTDLSKESDSLGYSARIPKDSKVKYLHNQRVGLLQFHSEEIMPDFIYYLLRTDEYHGFIVGSASGTSIMHTSPSRIKEYSFLLPSPSEQQAIASVLSNLDDKIDLLHCQNKTLEAMAETLFRQWFIEEADEGWEVRPLSSIANFLNGLACQKYPPKNEFERLPVLKIKELSSGISESSDWASTDINRTYIVQNGDVIFAWSASLMVKVWDGEKCILNQHLFKVSSDEFPKWFYLEWCKHHLAEFISISSSHATTMGHIKRGDLDTAMVIVPSERELSAMSKQMTPLLDRQIENAKQIRTIENLRDMLLPKLMSGEVRVAV